jgi:hypothetical protein
VAQKGADAIPVEGEVSVLVQACTATPGEVSACNGAHATTSAAQRVGMTSLAQVPLDSNPLATPGIVMAWGGEGEQESESYVSPSSKNFFELLPVDQFRSSELLMVHLFPSSLQVAPKNQLILKMLKQT